MKRAELKMLIKTRYGSCAAFAEHLGVSKQTVSNVVSGRTTPRNIPEWCDELAISPIDACVFFAPVPEKTKEEG